MILLLVSCSPKLRDILDAGERRELAHVMRTEPTKTGDLLSYAAASRLRQRGLLRRENRTDMWGGRQWCWVVAWEKIPRPLSLLKANDAPL